MRNLKKITMLVGTVAFLACPALSQQSATTGGPKDWVKTSGRLALPPASAPGGTLTTNRASTESPLRHRSLLQRRITILRNYVATTVLSARERLAVESSVKKLEASLGEIDLAILKEASGTMGRAPRSAPALNGSNSITNVGNNAALKSVGSLQDDDTPQGGQGPANPPAATKKEEKRFFDKRIFSLSGGIVLSKLEKREFQPVLGIARDINGMPTDGDTLTYVVGLKENNDWTVGPLLLLNTKFWERADRNFGFHGSVGITGKRDDAGTDIDYFVGPSISVLRGLLFFSGGLYIGKQQRLAGDAFLGAKIEKDDTVPVVKEYHSKPGFSVTFRIFPLPD